MVDCKNGHNSSHCCTFGIDFVTPPIKKHSLIFLLLDSGLGLWLALASIQEQTRCKTKQKCDSMVEICPRLLLLEIWNCQGKMPGLACWMMRNMWPNDSHASSTPSTIFMNEPCSMIRPPASPPGACRCIDEPIRDQLTWPRSEEPSWLTEWWLKPLDFGDCLLPSQRKQVYIPFPGHFLLSAWNAAMRLKMGQQPLQPWGWMHFKQIGVWRTDITVALVAASSSDILPPDFMFCEKSTTLSC